MSSGPPPKVPYAKPWLSCQDQLKLLESRGITVGDRPAAEAFLAHVNYYRLSGYCLAFEDARHSYPDPLTFEQVCQAYDFDRDLRDLVTEALEVIEVDLRAAVAHHFGKQYGAFGHTLPANFFRTFRHAEWLAKLREEADRSRELFVTHFRARYAEFPNLPVWIATEIMSFGGLSHMYLGMHKSDQKVVAKRYNLQPQTLQRAIHHFVYVRNLCAHHSRLWDRIWAIKPELPFGPAWRPPHIANNGRLFATLLLLYHMMRKIPSVAPFDSEWKARVFTRLDDAPSVADPLATMGLATNWKQHPVWV